MVSTRACLEIDPTALLRAKEKWRGELTSKHHLFQSGAEEPWETGASVPGLSAALGQHTAGGKRGGGEPGGVLEALA